MCLCSDVFLFYLSVNQLINPQASTGHILCSLWAPSQTSSVHFFLSKIYFLQDPNRACGFSRSFFWSCSPAMQLVSIKWTSLTFSLLFLSKKKKLCDNLWLDLDIVIQISFYTSIEIHQSNLALVPTSLIVYWLKSQCNNNNSSNNNKRICKFFKDFSELKL